MQQPIPFVPRGAYPPMSNTERQRLFRERHPDYYRKLKARQRARLKALRAELAAREAAAVAAKVVVKQPLMLPAPVEMILIPGLNAIPTTMTAVKEAELVR